MVSVVRGFGSSLRHGCKNIFESLPRLLTLFFEYRQLLPRGGQGDAAAAAAEMRAAMQEIRQALPLWVWITALPQLISRICHPDREASEFLQGLLVDLLLAFPDQARNCDQGRCFARFHRFFFFYLSLSLSACRVTRALSVPFCEEMLAARAGAMRGGS